MASPRDIRKLALLALYQLDARASSDDVDLDSIRSSLDDVHTLEEEGLSFADLKAEFTESQRDKAFGLAQRAYEQRESCDVVLNELSTDWMVSRMPVVDRSILRLAHYEMTRIEGSKPKAIVNESVELAKLFSTENSPGFINGILDKILKRVLAESNEPTADSATNV
jgi:transcription antitermination protein NusB